MMRNASGQASEHTLKSSSSRTCAITLRGTIASSLCFLAEYDSGTKIETRCSDGNYRASLRFVD